MNKQTPHVILAEDEPGLLRTMSMVLRAARFQVTAAANGKAALEAIRTTIENGSSVDLLITDIQMPILSGDQLIDEINRLDLAIPTLVITGFGAKDLVVALMRKGCNDYIDKPFTGDDLLKRVQGVLHKSEKTRMAREEHESRHREESARLSQEIARYKQHFERLRTQLDSAVDAYNNLAVVGDRETGAHVQMRSMPLSDLGGDCAAAAKTARGSDILLADVAGHDMGASYHTIMIKAFFDENVRRGHEGCEFFSILNRALLDSGAGRMVTAAFLRIDLRHMKAHVAAAAHLAATYVPRDNAMIEPLHVSGSPLGIFERVRFDTKTIAVKPGDRFVLYSDGFPGLCRIDGANGRKLRLSPAGIDNLIEQHRVRPLPAFTDALWNSALSFARYKSDDDLMLMVIEVPENDYV